MIDLLTSAEAWAALLTLTALEIVLGIDNVIFLSVIVARIPEPQASHARRIGLSLALVFRILLLTFLVWLIGLTRDVFVISGMSFSWRDLILIGGGLFLIAKATHEIHAEVEGDEEGTGQPGGRNAFFWVIAQIIVIDLVFSLDSIITAIGMASELAIMIAAVVIACIVMYASSGPVSRFVAEHPDHQNAGAGVSGADRRGAGRRWLRVPHPARLHLLRHRVFGGGGVLQRACQAQSQEGNSLGATRGQVDNTALMALFCASSP